MMLKNSHQRTPDERAAVTARIEDAFSFMEDIFEVPSVLDRIPNGTSIQLSRLPAGDEHVSVVTHTKRYAVLLSGKSNGLEVDMTT